MNPLREEQTLLEHKTFPRSSYYFTLRLQPSILFRQVCVGLMCIVLQTVAMIIEAHVSSAGTGIWCGIPVSILNQNLNRGLLQKVITTKDLFFITYCDLFFFYFDVLQQELCRNFTLTVCKHMVPLLLTTCKFIF